MATFGGNFMCTSFKGQLLEGVHDFRATGGDAFKLALYTGAAGVNLNGGTTAYTDTTEIPDSGTYTAGGGLLTSVGSATFGTTAFTGFSDLSFTSATITARGALIYNTTPAHTYTNPSVVVLDFGGDKTSTSGTFTIQFPVSDASSAIIRIV